MAKVQIVSLDSLPFEAWVEIALIKIQRPYQHFALTSKIGALERNLD